MTDDLKAQAEATKVEPVAWQPIETAPKDGTYFLAYWPVNTFSDRYQVTQWDGCERFVDNADHIDWLQPSHWMPLPPAPKGQSDE